ncbi:hypothetical protein Tco_0418750 [Tanacetum coccineum]
MLMPHSMGLLQRYIKLPLSRGLSNLAYDRQIGHIREWDSYAELSPEVQGRETIDVRHQQRKRELGVLAMASSGGLLLRSYGKRVAVHGHGGGMICVLSGNVGRRRCPGVKGRTGNSSKSEGKKGSSIEDIDEIEAALAQLKRESGL